MNKRTGKIGRMLVHKLRSFLHQILSWALFTEGKELPKKEAGHFKW